MTRDNRRYGPALPAPRLRGNILTDIAAGALTACLIVLIASFVSVL